MRSLVLAAICNLSIVTSSTLIGAQAQQFANKVSTATSGKMADSLPLPPAPSGKSTVFGGEIRNIDPVRDELILGVFGNRPLKMQFDERTQVYRDGKRISLRELTNAGHASIETTLDGAKLFAVSIHVLSRVPEGEFSGRVLSYNPDSGELTIVSSRSSESLKLLVRRETRIARKGQSVFASVRSGPADLMKGSLVSVHFGSVGNQGEATASEIDVLAVPGATFVFSGDIVSIDLHSGSLVLHDPQDEQNHEILFSRIQTSSVESIRTGDSIRVVASYDGTNYVVREISMMKP